MPSWLLADNNQCLAAIYPLLLKLSPRILHIPTCFPWHFYLDSPPLLGIPVLWFCGWFPWTGSTSQFWSHTTPIPQGPSNVSHFWSLHIWCVSYLVQKSLLKVQELPKKIGNGLKPSRVTHMLPGIPNKKYSKPKIANKSQITGQTLPFPKEKILFFARKSPLKPSLLSILL